MQQHEDTIQRVVCEVREFFDSPFPAEPRELRKTKGVCRTRAVCALILRRVTDLKLKEIGGCVGLGAPGAVANAIERARNDTWRDDILRAFVLGVIAGYRNE